MSYVKATLCFLLFQQESSFLTSQHGNPNLVPPPRGGAEGGEAAELADELHNQEEEVQNQVSHRIRNRLSKPGPDMTFCALPDWVNFEFMELWNFGFFYMFLPLEVRKKRPSALLSYR